MTQLQQIPMAIIAFFIGLFAAPASAAQGKGDKSGDKLGGFNFLPAFLFFLASPIFAEETRENPPLIHYSVAVEAYSNHAWRVSAESAIADIAAILEDKRGWAAQGEYQFSFSSEADADIRILIASPETVDALCAPYKTRGKWSCSKPGGQVVLNIDRWESAVPHWTTGIKEYRAYLINHKIGHHLGFRDVRCRVTGQLARVMQQQSISLNGCLPNGWPYP